MEAGRGRRVRNKRGRETKKEEVITRKIKNEKGRGRGR